MDNNNEFIFINIHSQDYYELLVKDNSIITFKLTDKNNEATSCQNVIMIHYTPFNCNTLKYHYSGPENNGIFRIKL
jgi:hypothetical protein